MNAPEPALPHVPADASVPWQALPRRGRWLFALQGVLGGAGIALVISVAAGALPGPRWTLGAILLGWVCAPLCGAWLGLRVHRFIAWRLDDTGFALRRGRAWFSETRVPAARVQHVDVKHGPLARRFGLATLVLHTAGTRDSAVSVPGLDVDQAGQLRDVLARQHTLDADD